MDRRREQLLLYIQQLEAQLKGLFGNTYAEALKLADVRKAIENGQQFTWKGNPAAERQLNQQLQQLAKVTGKTIRNGITGAWKEGEGEVKDAILARFGKGKNSKEVNSILEDAVKAQRAKGMNAHAFAARKEGGLTLSNRVWNLAGSAKKDLEIIIQNGILEGKGADEIARGLEGYLNEPDKLFRRVRNKETGELELSEAAKKYHPGQGVYRSSYKNALRLAITEKNAAYRRADWESYQNNPLIIGYRIELSNNHTVVINGKVRILYDICDVMAGKEYPKTFLWTGWHPHCRCRMIPIMISDEDFKARQKARQAGKLDEWKPKRNITEPPKAFYDWVEANKERAKGWANMPLFVKDNKTFIKDFKVDTYSEQEKKFTRARQTIEAMERAVKELSELYPKIENTNLAALHHYTKQGGNYRQLNKQLNKGTLTEFNKASASLMAKGLASLPAYKGIVYRGSIMKRKEYESIYEGRNEVTHSIFTSASKDAGTAFKFASYRDLKKNEVRVLFEIQSKKGRDISGISEFNGKFASDNQREVLFDRNAKFVITKKETDKSGTIWIEMQEK
jgi:hypothetical protein